MGFEFKLAISHDQTSADSMENWFPGLRCRLSESIVLIEEMDWTKTNLGISANSGVFVEEVRRAGGSPD